GARPVARRICDEPVVLYRGRDGAAAALFDRCCHRGAPLSVGVIVDTGLQCGYHGLVFAADGHCVHIPGQTFISNKVCVRSYPVLEKDQLVWIWMGEPAAADTSLIVDYPFHNDRARWPHRHDVYHVKASYLMLTDNL